MVSFCASRLVLYLCFASHCSIKLLRYHSPRLKLAPTSPGSPSLAQSLRCAQRGVVRFRSAKPSSLISLPTIPSTRLAPTSYHLFSPLSSRHVCVRHQAWVHRLWSAPKQRLAFPRWRPCPLPLSRALAQRSSRRRPRTHPRDYGPPRQVRRARSSRLLTP